MADYDVSAQGLSTPPTAAVVTPYRPAVSVRNNGLHDAVASGYVRIYAAGLLIYESEIYSNTLSPGETGDAEALTNWTPPAEGTYIIQGYVSTPLDQVEPNNNLNPVTVLVGPGEPPEPPTPVTIHASQHEEGGADELSIEGLRGRTGDLQNPINHASAHEFGGSDPINLSGMPGKTMESQVPEPHANSHHVAGSDPLNVDDIPGADELERLENKNVANGYAGLESNGFVYSDQLAVDPVVGQEDFALRFDRTWGPAQSTGETVHVGLCAVWDGTNPIPTGWTSIVISPAPSLPYIWITYVGGGG